MFFSFRGLLRSSLSVSVALYAAGILLAGTVTALGSYRVAKAVFAELAPASAVTRAAPKTGQRPQQRKVAASTFPSGQAVGRQAFMTPLQARATRLPELATGALPRQVLPVVFGSSSRYPDRSSGRNRDDDDDEDERPVERGTFRTVCVRLCDGYYFPISFSVARDRFEHDAKVCERSCGEQARLFVYPNPGGDIEGMQDLRGRPYRQLSTAFLYRKEYVAACRCQANPWDTESSDRHRLYALAAAKSKGNKQAAKELAELKAKMKQSAKGPLPPAVLPTIESQGTARSTLGTAQVMTAQPRADTGDGQPKMGLGARTAREPRARSLPRNVTKDGDADWRRRALGQGV